MMSRSESRSLAMTILYQIEILKENRLEYDVDAVLKENMEIENEFVKDLVYGVITTEKELVEQANKYLKDWNLNRLDKVGATILKLALYELKYMDTPSIVVINEAVELTKKYSDEELAKMINAVLDRVVKE